MHLSEGIINSPWILGGGAVLACGGVAVGLRRLDDSHALRTAVLGSGFFVASLVHIPVLGTSVHLSLGGLLGIVLGWAAFPAVLVALILWVYAVDLRHAWCPRRRLIRLPPRRNRKLGRQ